MSTHPKPVPELTELNRPFFDAAADGRLSVQRCSPCGHLWFPPSHRCPACLSIDVSWVDVSGKATLWSWVRVHQKYFPGFVDELPYLVGFVRLAEGPMMMTGIVGATQDELTCDLPLEVVLESSGADLVLPRFTPDVAARAAS